MPNLRAPQVEIVDLREDYVEFVLSNTDTSVANALRRVMIAEVPTMAIDLVTIHDNSSVLQDEFLSHRLGLIPLAADHGKQYEYNYDCDCEDYCHKCSAVFTLDVSWEKKSLGRPEHMRDQPVLVTSADLVGTDPELRPVHFAPSDQTNSDISQDAGIVIAKLAKGQRMQLTAVAKKGIAKEHAKWSPVAVATYKFEPIIEINEEKEALLTPEQKAEFVEICPAKVYGRDEKTGTIFVEHRDMCMYCDDCVYLAKTYKARPEDDPVVKIRPRDDRFIFSVETNGSITAEEVVVTALKVISDKLLNLRNDLMRMGDGEPWKSGD
ncbi:unnamed protein product [Pylaiella littoralis]